ncbi:MAG: hypothetical protein QOE49_4056, partial [Rhodospirillaceae bacterium]|nr:hypothetical protein [Rhodospirillaceae bacterium]
PTPELKRDGTLPVRLRRGKDLPPASAA